MLFNFKATKNKGEVEIEIKGDFSQAQIDIALKDICIYLMLNKHNADDFVNENNGFLEVDVKNYDRELTLLEKSYANINRYPMNEVVLRSKGFGFESIKDVMSFLQTKFADEYDFRFLYGVDFNNLTIN